MQKLDPRPRLCECTVEQAMAVPSFRASWQFLQLHIPYQIIQQSFPPKRNENQSPQKTNPALFISVQKWKHSSGNGSVGKSAVCRTSPTTLVQSPEPTVEGENQPPKGVLWLLYTAQQYAYAHTHTHSNNQ